MLRIIRPKERVLKKVLAKPLPSKLTSAAAVLTFMQCLPSRCLAIDYFFTEFNVEQRKGESAEISCNTTCDLFT
jgi:hypothetical protein